MTTQPRPAPAAAPAPPSVSVPPSATRAAAAGVQVPGRSTASRLLPGRTSATTPRRLGLARLAHVVLAVVLGIGAVVTAAQLDQREAQAEVHAAQYVRTAQLQTHLLTAHTAASRASLSGSTEQVTESRTALDAATSQLVEAAGQQTGDGAALATISHHLLRYTEALGRAQLQRGTTQGRAALAAANDLLREDLLPAVQQLQDSHGAFSTSGVAWWMWLLPVLGWLTVAAIVGISWYTAQVSHRVVNPGLAVAAAATLVLAISAGNLVAGHNAGTAGSVRAEFSGVQDLTTAQRAGIGAFAQLSNAVATRTWSSKDAAAYTASLDEAAELLDSAGADPVASTLRELRGASEQLATAAGAGDWEKAAAALGKSGAGDPAQAAAGFRGASQDAVDQSLADLRAAVRTQGGQTTGFAVLAVVCALLSATAGTLGLGQRLKEYR